jgi:hypothetical protein
MVLVKGYLYQRNLMWKPDVSLSRHKYLTILNSISKIEFKFDNSNLKNYRIFQFKVLFVPFKFII